MTLILKINPKKPEIKKIKIAADILSKGGLVAFPTETVYGLGANALDKNAIKNIFLAKGRPNDNPLIVHIAERKQVHNLAKKIPKKAKMLMDKFWPGPITIVLKRQKIVPDEVTGKLDTVGIRMPSNKIALKLIKTAKIPLAAPSANISGKPSPTSGKHVIKDLNNKIDAIIDGGDAKIGLESTVIDLTQKIPVILRPGKITLKQIKKIIGTIKISSHANGKISDKTKVKSPGMKYKHYSPNAEVILVEGDEKKIKNKLKSLKNKYSSENKKVRIINSKCKQHLAKNIFREFRECDEKKIDTIIVAGVKEIGIGLAVMNRLRKAATKIIKV